jgi:hypothetical protein
MSLGQSERVEKTTVDAMPQAWHDQPSIIERKAYQDVRRSQEIIRELDLDDDDLLRLGESLKKWLKCMADRECWGVVETTI